MSGRCSKADSRISSPQNSKHGGGQGAFLGAAYRLSCHKSLLPLLFQIHLQRSSWWQLPCQGGGTQCLNPQGWGTLRANQDGAMRRLCGHIVCPRCVVATARGNTCRCCVRDRVPAEAVGRPRRPSRGRLPPAEGAPVEEPEPTPGPRLAPTPKVPGDASRTPELPSRRSGS